MHGLPRLSRRLVELASSLKSTFEPVIHRQLFPRSEIVVQVVVEVQDGGELGRISSALYCGFG